MDGRGGTLAAGGWYYHPDRIDLIEGREGERGRYVKCRPHLFKLETFLKKIPI